MSTVRYRPVPQIRAYVRHAENPPHPHSLDKQEHMTYAASMPHEPFDFRELGIASSYEAAELERELDVRFSEFTPPQVEIWHRQTLCLEQYARTRTNSSAARAGGVSAYTMTAWERDNVLGFTRRKEIADREFCDGIEELLLARARMPDSPPSLLTAVVRAQMPEKYGSSRYDREHNGDGDGHADGPDTYHRLLADIIQVLQDREGAAEADGLGTASSGEEGASHDVDTADTRNEDSGADPAPTESRHLASPDQSSKEAGLQPAPDASLAAMTSQTEESPTQLAPAPVVPQRAVLNRQQRRKLQRQAKRQKSHLARAPN